MYLVGFTIRIFFFTMHGHLNVKYGRRLSWPVVGYVHLIHLANLRNVS